MTTATLARPTTTARLDHIAVESLRESKTNPRHHFAGLDELTASVRQHGVLTPLLVREIHVSDQKGSTFEIIAGARRYRAAKSAKLEKVPVRILELTEEQALEFQVIENLQREDVHPLDEALGYQQLLKAGKYDVPALALKVNKSESYVYQRLKLTALIPEAQKACFDGKITAGHAILIARLQPKQQKESLAETLKYSRSVRDLAHHIENEYHLTLNRAPWALDDATLVPSAGSCVDCPKRTGASPQLFADVKAKDTCTDPGCFRAKLEATAARNKEKGLISISGDSLGYRAKPLLGVLYHDSFTEARGQKCKDTHPAIVIAGHQYGHLKLGQKLDVCTAKKNCKTHGYNSGPSSPVTTSPAERKKQRRFRAIGEARTQATRQIAAKTKWPVTKEQFGRLLLAWYDRLTFDAQKMTCRVLEIWPKDGKTGAFNFRGRLKQRVTEAAGNGDAMAQIAAVFTLVPEFGGWGGGFSGDAKEKERLYSAGKTVGVDVARIERQAISAAEAKAKKKAKGKAKAKPKAKAQTSAK